MHSHVFTILAFAAYFTTPGRTFAQALHDGCAPGGNFNMKPWELQLPIGIPGSNLRWRLGGIPLVPKQDVFPHRPPWRSHGDLRARRSEPKRAA
jgi:hypothetical protein